jgi:hypothetical protein
MMGVLEIGAALGLLWLLWRLGLLGLFARLAWVLVTLALGLVLVFGGLARRGDERDILWW